MCRGACVNYIYEKILIGPPLRKTETAVFRQNMDEKRNKLLRAVSHGDLTTLRELVSKLKNHVDLICFVYAKTGDSAVHIAVENGHLSVLKYLHNDCGMGLEQTNFDGKRPLHNAAQFSHFDCLQYLIDQGVEIDALKRADWTPLMLACTKNNENIVRFLVSNGANLQLENKDGWTSFHLACREGDVSIVSYLLSVNPEIWKTRSKNGRTPLHTAALHGHETIVEILLSVESAYYPPDSCGSTPFMDAIRSGFVQIARRLFKDDLKCCNARDQMGRSAIHFAAQAGNTESIDFLLDECRININCESGDLSRPLHFAAREGHCKIILHLLRRDADPLLTDSYGRTAADLARGFNRQSCLQVLEKATVDS